MSSTKTVAHVPPVGPVNSPSKAFSMAVISTKGGVGKTTLCANVGAALADLGYRVLLIDADAQPSLSKYYPIVHQAEYGLTNVLHTKMVTVDDISYTDIDGLHIIVSDDTEKALQHWLQNRLDRATRLRIALNSPVVNQNYDFVLIDTQGAAGPLQEAAALAVDMMISPITPDTMSTREFLEGTMELLDRLEAGVSLGAPPGIMQAIIYRQERLRDSSSIARYVRNEFTNLRGKVSIVDAVVPSSKAFKEAATRSTPVHRYEPAWEDTVLDANGHILSIGTGASIIYRLIWDLIPSLDGSRPNAHLGGQNE